MNFFKTQLERLRLWLKLKPKTAVPILGGAALAVLLLISILAAVIMQDDTSQQTGSQEEQQVIQVDITKDGFNPATVLAKKGSKIIWTNKDQSMHQLQANPHPTGESLPGLKSEILDSTQTYEYTADTPGTFEYHDHINPTTNGKIEVQE